MASHAREASPTASIGGRSLNLTYIGVVGVGPVILESLGEDVYGLSALEGDEVVILDVKTTPREVC